MQSGKNLLIGFLISFWGSIPLGYLNFIGFNIFQQSGILSTAYYIAGVVIVETIVLYVTLLLSKSITLHAKIIRFIDGFSVLLLFVIAIIFYESRHTTSTYLFVGYTPKHFFFIKGMLLSSLNFFQIPFWLGWNLYLINTSSIEVTTFRKYFYLFGTLFGTLIGMLAFILGFNFFITKLNLISYSLLNMIIPLFFIGLGIVKCIRYFEKYSI